MSEMITEKVEQQMSESIVQDSSNIKLPISNTNPSEKLIGENDLYRPFKVISGEERGSDYIVSPEYIELEQKSETLTSLEKLHKQYLDKNLRLWANRPKDKGIVNFKKDFEKLSNIISERNSKLVNGLVDIIHKTSFSILDVLEDCDDPEIDRNHYNSRMFLTPKDLPVTTTLPHHDILYPAHNFLFKLAKINEDLKNLETHYDKSMNYSESIIQLVNELHDDINYFHLEKPTFYMRPRHNRDIRYTDKEAQIVINNLYVKAFESIVHVVPRCEMFKSQIEHITKQMVTLKASSIYSYCEYKRQLDQGPKKTYHDERGYEVNSEKYSCVQPVMLPTEDNECFNDHVKDLDKYCEVYYNEGFETGKLADMIIDTYSTRERPLENFHINDESICKEFSMFGSLKNSTEQAQAINDVQNDNYLLRGVFFGGIMGFLLVLAIYLIKKKF